MYVYIYLLLHDPLHPSQTRAWPFSDSKLTMLLHDPFLSGSVGMPPLSPYTARPSSPSFQTGPCPLRRLEADHVASRCARRRPLHDNAITNIVWCIWVNPAARPLYLSQAGPCPLRRLQTYDVTSRPLPLQAGSMSPSPLMLPDPPPPSRPVHVPFADSKLTMLLHDALGGGPYTIMPSPILYGVYGLTLLPDPSILLRPVHVPFADSKLTMLLHDALGGGARTTVLICASLEPSDAIETISALRFGEVRTTRE